MRISVLIAVQQGGTALPKVLASVGAQAHEDWRLFVVDCGTGPDTEREVKRFAEQHSSVVFERLTDGGLADARNRLLDLAEGDAIAFLEASDIWLPRHLSACVQLLDAGTDVVVANARMQDPRSNRTPTEVTMPVALGTAPIRTLFSRDVIPSLSCVAVRREIATAAGHFDARFRGAEARDYWLRCAVNGARFALAQKVSCQCGSGTTAAAERALQQAEQAVQFYEKHRDLSAVPAALRRRLLAGSLVAHGRLLRSADPGRAARCFWRAWSLQPVQVQTLGQFALTEWRFATPTEPHDVG